MTKIKIAIKNRWTGDIIFEYEKEGNTMAETINEYVRQALAKYERANLTRADLTDANLTHANLTDANLTRADLTRADLTHADLTHADLTDADLTDANLTHANLTRADLTHADLTRADLTRADLTHADLTDADLTDADLTHADLTDADLTHADLRIFKNDMFVVLLTAIPEIANLKKAIKEGKIDGSTYTGECACLAGTLMKCSNPEIRSRVDRLKDSSRPIERWFMMIKPGHTPENNQAAKLALEWIEEFEGYIAFLMPETLNQ